jgi:hypothetical protein
MPYLDISSRMGHMLIQMIQTQVSLTLQSRSSFNDFNRRDIE